MGRKKKPENEKATKPGVSLDHECRIILSKILEWELSVQNNDLTASQAIRKCMRIAWQSHYEKIFSEYEAKQIMDGVALLNEESPQKSSSKPSKIQPRVGVVIEPELETSDTLSSTRMTGRSRKNG
jgi:hypothetical protein